MHSLAWPLTYRDLVQGAQPLGASVSPNGKMELLGIQTSWGLSEDQMNEQVHMFAVIMRGPPESSLPQSPLSSGG